MANKMKSLMESILGKMTDESGLFQGGEQGRAFGRIRDLFGGGGGAHENIDAAIELSGGGAGYGGGEAPELHKGDPGYSTRFTEPSRYWDILKAARPDIYERQSKSSSAYPDAPIQEGYTGSVWRHRGGWETGKVDDIMRAILGNQFGDKQDYSMRKPDYSAYEDMYSPDNVWAPRDVTDIVKWMNELKNLPKYEGDK